jgi:hypothetical protein
LLEPTNFLRSVSSIDEFNGKEQMKATGAGCPGVYGALLPGEIENWTNPASQISQIRNPKYPKYEIGLPRAGPIRDFGFRI